MNSSKFASGLDILFDPVTMPTSLSHTDLMGRPRLLPSSSSNSIPSTSTDRAPTPPPKGVPDLQLKRPLLHKRASSLDLPAPRNRAGVGARGAQITIAGSSDISLGSGVDSVSGNMRETSSLEARSGRLKDSRAGDDHRPLTSKAELMARSGNNARIASGRYSRRSSELTTQPITIRHPAQNSQSRTSSLDPRSLNPVFMSNIIPLQTTSKTMKLLSTLQSLTPKNRIQQTIPLPTSGLLHPISLLTPLAIILEALVSERTLLKHPYNQINNHANGSYNKASTSIDGMKGDISAVLDWNTTKTYILTLGSVMNTLIPMLREKEGVEDLLKGVRIYVGKLKKVFGEVAAGYVDGYGFVRGWWDEEGMKGSAGEVGRWGDVFDA